MIEFIGLALGVVFIIGSIHMGLNQDKASNTWTWWR